MEKKEFNQLKRAVKEAPLTEKEKLIITHRLGLDNNITHTLNETGKTFGVTRERVRQIIAKILCKLEDGGYLERSENKDEKENGKKFDK